MQEWQLSKQFWWWLWRTHQQVNHHHCITFVSSILTKSQHLKFTLVMPKTLIGLILETISFIMVSDSGWWFFVPLLVVDVPWSARPDVIKSLGNQQLQTTIAMFDVSDALPMVYTVMMWWWAMMTLDYRPPQIVMEKYSWQSSCNLRIHIIIIITHHSFTEYSFQANGTSVNCCIPQIQQPPTPPCTTTAAPTLYIAGSSPSLSIPSIFFASSHHCRRNSVDSTRNGRW